MYTFRWVFVEVLRHSFNFVNMRFVGKVIFFFVTSFFTFAYVPLNEYISVYRKQFSP